MKYQTISISVPTAAPPEELVANREPHQTSTRWPAWDNFIGPVIANGGIDPNWGPLDSVTDEPNWLKKTTITWNTLEAAEGFYNLVVGPDGEQHDPVNVFYNKIVEINDDGTFVRLIKESNNNIPN